MYRYFFFLYRPISPAQAYPMRRQQASLSLPVRSLSLGMLLLLTLVSGCASSDMRNTGQTVSRTNAVYNPAYMGDNGSSWEAVLPGPDVAIATDSLRTSQASWILSRADDSLSPRSPVVPLATNWPTASRPSLNRPRTIQLFRNADSFIYYRHERRTTNYSYSH